MSRDNGTAPSMKFLAVRFTIRRMMLAVALAAPVFSYVGSYWRLSRRGMREAAEYGMTGFLYIPIRETAEPINGKWHYALMIGYAPLNWLDRKLLGTPGPAICFTRLTE